MPPANKSLDAQVNWIVQIRQQAVQKIAYMNKKLGFAPEATSKKSQHLYEQVDDLLKWLENDAHMSPDLKQRSKIDEGLKLMFDRPEFLFPQSYAERAKALHERFEGESWGAQKDITMNDAEGGQPRTPRRPASTRVRRQDSASPEPAIIREPRPDHPIWGLNGIVHGLALSVSSSRKSLIYDERYAHERRSGKVFGHNDIEVGSWFPRQLAACFHGAHGAAQAGISGTAETGVWSIVVSGQYDDLDTDPGNYLY